MSRSSASLRSSPHLPHRHPGLQRLPHPWQGVVAKAQAHPLAGVSLAEWLAQLQNTSGGAFGRAFGRRATGQPTPTPVPATVPTVFRSFVPQVACGIAPHHQTELASVLACYAVCRRRRYGTCKLPGCRSRSSAVPSRKGRRVLAWASSSWRSPSSLPWRTRTWLVADLPDAVRRAARALTKSSKASGKRMLELFFHYVAPRFILAAGPCTFARLSATCMFACDVLNGPREHQVVRVFG